MNREVGYSGIEVFGWLVYYYFVYIKIISGFRMEIKYLFKNTIHLR